MRSLPDTSTQWESNPRPSELESNAQFTWPHAPITPPDTIIVNEKHSIE